MEKTKFTVEEYLEESKKGRWCAIVGCKEPPTEICSCGARYCIEHSQIHFHVGGDALHFSRDAKGGEVVGDSPKG